MHNVITERREKIAEACRRYHVRRLAAFGSVLRKDFRSEDSDIDFLVEFETLPLSKHADNYFGMLDALTELFERKVDLVVWTSIKNPYFLREVESSREMLYVA